MSCDTPLQLKRRGFLGASFADGWNPSQVPRVQRATLPHKGVTILLWRRPDMPRFPGVVLAEQVRTAHPISMPDKPTHRTAIDAAFGFGTVQTLGAGLARIGFFDQVHA